MLFSCLNLTSKFEPQTLIFRPFAPPVLFYRIALSCVDMTLFNASCIGDATDIHYSSRLTKCFLSPLDENPASSIKVIP